MDAHQLTSRIKEYALGTAGFDLAGVTRAALPSRYEEGLLRWTEEGFAAGMEYMKREPSRRAHPEASLPSVRSVVSLAVNYWHPDDARPAGDAGKVSKYAYGADYHDVIGAKLKDLARFVADAGGPGTETKTYVDTGPVLEKAFAREAGLGFFGKNTNVITKEYGSWVFLASLLTNLELVYDEPHAGACGTCRLCLDACPTGALLDGYRLDAGKCISYLTIESKEAMPEELKGRLDGWVFGCDACQDVCPYNKKAKPTRHAELHPAKKAGTWIGIDEALSLGTDEAFAARFKGSPVKRPKRAGLLRNARALREGSVA